MAIELRATQSGFAVGARASEPPFLAIPSLAPAPRDTPMLFVFGSSVSLGKGAKINLGWVDVVRSKTRFRLNVENLSISGGATATILELLTNNKDTPALANIISTRDAAVVSLSLSNEGLAQDGASHQHVARRFLRGVTQIVVRLGALGFHRILLATPYPCSRFDAAHHRTVQAVIRDLKLQYFKSPVQIVDFYNSRLRMNGTGKWLAACRADDFHPNATGHATMAALFLEAFY